MFSQGAADSGVLNRRRRGRCCDGEQDYDGDCQRGQDGECGSYPAARARCPKPLGDAVRFGLCPGCFSGAVVRGPVSQSPVLMLLRDSKGRTRRGCGKYPRGLRSHGAGR